MAMATIAELAAESFEKRERLMAMALMGIPTDYEKRKQSYIAYAQAEADALSAQRRLDDAIRGK